MFVLCSEQIKFMNAPNFGLNSASYSTDDSGELEDLHARDAMLAARREHFPCSLLLRRRKSTRMPHAAGCVDLQFVLSLWLVRLPYL